MNENTIRQRLEDALKELVRDDRYLLQHDLSERCIAARLAMHLQRRFPYDVDVEYNRDGASPKKLGLPEACANYEEGGEKLVVPDVIVHRRGPDGPNVLVIEIKKTTNKLPHDCDFIRIDAFREQFHYAFGAFVEFETRPGCDSGVKEYRWFS